MTISRLTRPGDIILDPFMGSGTTLVEAQRLGRLSVGIDVNPISCMMARSKTLPLSAEKVALCADSVKLRLAAEWDRIPVAEPPEQVQMDKWYTGTTARDLLKIWSLIQSNDHGHNLLHSAFSAILLPACRETRHWGYVCDNTTPKTSREVDVRDLYLNALARYVRAYLERDRLLRGDVPAANVIRGDSVLKLAELPDEHCSAMVTSPPYYGVADYVKAQRLSMEWFAFPIEPFRRSEIGARSKRHRRDSAKSYLDELALVFHEAHRVLKPGSVGIIIFGQSPSRPDLEPDFVQQLCSAGFSIELERKRQIPATRRLRPSLVDETVLVIRK